MNTSNYTKAPTREESISYFEKLSAPGRPDIDFSAPAMFTLDEHTEVLMPRALAQTDEPDVDPNSLAEIGKDEPLVVAFSDGVSLQNRKAIMMSMKFAETAARIKNPGKPDRVKWLADYNEGMFHGGWLGFADRLGTLKTQDLSVTMDSLAIDVISAIAGPNKAAVLQLLSLTLDKLQKSDGLIKLFESNSLKESTSTFRIMPCLESPEGIPVTYLLAMEIDFSKHTGGTLFWKWAVTHLQVRSAVANVEFYPDLYEPNKLDMLKTIRDHATGYFESLSAS
ncbi:hypothetical protein PS3A_30710 [Pseudomonas sp. 3A(2025)]